jgi:hypothetical protein
MGNRDGSLRAFPMMCVKMVQGGSFGATRVRSCGRAGDRDNPGDCSIRGCVWQGRIAL